MSTDPPSPSIAELRQQLDRTDDERAERKSALFALPHRISECPISEDYAK
jgi:hypothetical protein